MEFDYVTAEWADTQQTFEIKRSKVKVTAKRQVKTQWKRYKTAASWSSDFILGMGVSVSVKSENDWRGVGRSIVAMHRDCHMLLYYNYNYYKFVGLACLFFIYSWRLTETQTRLWATSDRWVFSSNSCSDRSSSSNRVVIVYLWSLVSHRSVRERAT